METTVLLKCENCNNFFERRAASYRQKLSQGTVHFYCSRECKTEHRAPKLRSCLTCGKDFKPTGSVQKFCSRSCSASYNNTHSPKRSRTSLYCVTCDKPAEVVLGGECRKCRIAPGKDWTLGEIRESKSSTGFHAFVRSRSRTTYLRSARPKACEICGYDKYFEVAHISPVGSFSDETPLSEVNALENLVALCRNHHWEFDHGVLKLR